MDFPLRRVGERNMHYFESDEDSSVQLVFLPSGFNPGLWKHQLKYFSRSFKTIAFQPSSDERDRMDEIQCLEEILDQEEVKNAVLVSHHLGNSIAQKMEYNENVVGIVTTGSREKFRSGPPKSVFRTSRKVLTGEPKLVKKLFFSENTDYRVVKEFVNDVQVPSFQSFKDYIESYRIEKPVKHAMMVHAKKDRFSDLDYVRSMTPGPRISVIQDAGTFSFYEKPGEYNKALNDFLRGVDDFVAEQELAEAKSNNMSLKDFSAQERVKKVKVER